jgi:predicted RecB family nuclease
MVKRKITEGQTTQWSTEKLQKVRQHNGQKKNQRRYDNTIVKRNITEGMTVQWSKEKCLTCDFSFGHCVV